MLYLYKYNVIVRAYLYFTVAIFFIFLEEATPMLVSQQEPNLSLTQQTHTLAAQRTQRKR